MPFHQRSLIVGEVWFSPCFVRQNQQQNPFLRGDFRRLPNKNVQIRDHFLPFVPPEDFESLKILDIQLREMRARRRLNSTLKVNRQTDGQTHRRTDRRTFRLIAQRADALKYIYMYIYELTRHAQI